MTRVPIFLIGALLSTPGFAGDTESSVRRYAVIIGANEGGPRRVPLRYAHTDARAIAEVLVELGGVALEDRVLLLEPNRVEIDRALADLSASVDKGSGRTELILYYSGHSNEEGLLLGGSLYPYRDLRLALTKLPVDVRIGILDSCASGALTRAKGGQRRAPFLLDASTQVAGHAFLTSSSADEAAQESDAIGASFFTHYLISGLRGAADTTADGRVTLNEAYHFAFNETLARTEKTQGGAQHASYDIQLAGSGDLVMTDLRVTSAGLLLEKPLAGRVYVHDARDRLVAELNKSAGRRVELGLEPGEYRLTLRSGDQLFEGTVGVRVGSRAPISGDNLVPVDGERTAVRGDTLALTLTYERTPVRFCLLPVLHADPPVIADVMFGLLLGTATQVDSVALSLVGNSIDEDAHGFVSSLGLNYIGRDLKGLALAVGGNVVKGRVGGLSFATGFNIAGGNVEAGQGASGFNIASHDVHGFQAAAGFNIAGGKMSFVQAAAGFNIAGDNVKGVQAAAGFNIAGGNVKGVQAAAGFNIARKDVGGAQLASGFNAAGDIDGAQISVLNIAGNVDGTQIGVINIAGGTVRGVQVGLINVSDDIEGLPIGLLNWANKGQRHLALWSSPQERLNFEIRFGSHYVYTLIMAGFNSPEEKRRWYAALGVGGTIPIDPLALNLDLSAGSTHKGGFDVIGINDENVRAQLRAFLSYQLFEHLGLFAGASLNTFIGFHGNDIDIDNAPQFVREYPDGSVTTLRLWPSFFAGLQI